MNPTFQPQNPALNGYSLGWLSCTAYSAGEPPDDEQPEPENDEVPA